MAASGQNFEGVVTVGDPPETVSQSLIGVAAGLSEYTIATAGERSIVFTRRYTPNWAIVVAIVGTFLFVIGLLLLLYKDTETLTIGLAPVEGGTRVAISGIATSEMITRINAALTSMTPYSGDQAAAT